MTLEARFECVRDRILLLAYALGRRRDAFLCRVALVRLRDYLLASHNRLNFALMLLILLHMRLLRRHLHGASGFHRLVKDPIQLIDNKLLVCLVLCDIHACFLDGHL